MHLSIFSPSQLVMVLLEISWRVLWDLGGSEAWGESVDGGGKVFEGLLLGGGERAEVSVAEVGVSRGS